MSAVNIESSHIEIMRAIATDLSELPMVLKGGTALLLCYGLDRFSEDLDFDAPKKFNIAGRVERVLSKYTKEATVNTVKDTATVQRLKIHYRIASGATPIERLLKIETSFRQSPSSDSVEVRNGIKTYKVSSLIDQKLAALEGRTKARDLYDVVFLTRKYRTEFSNMAVQKLNHITSDIDALQGRFHAAFEDDSILQVEQLPSLLLQLETTLK